MYNRYVCGVFCIFIGNSIYGSDIVIQMPSQAALQSFFALKKQLPRGLPEVLANQAIDPVMLRGVLVYYVGERAIELSALLEEAYGKKKVSSGKSMKKGLLKKCFTAGVIQRFRKK